jgi:hypothetical protein
MVQGSEGLVRLNPSIDRGKGHPAEAQGTDLEAVAKVDSEVDRL